MRMPSFTTSVKRQSSKSCTVPTNGRLRSIPAGMEPRSAMGIRIVMTRVPGRRGFTMEQTSPFCSSPPPPHVGDSDLELRALRDAEIDEPTDEVGQWASLIAGPRLQLHELLLGQEDVHPTLELGWSGDATSPRRCFRFHHRVPRGLGTGICCGWLRGPDVRPSGYTCQHGSRLTLHVTCPPVQGQHGSALTSPRDRA